VSPSLPENVLQSPTDSDIPFILEPGEHWSDSEASTVIASPPPVSAIDLLPPILALDVLFTTLGMAC
jgi:hypothetical protein